MITARRSRVNSLRIPCLLLALLTAGGTATASGPLPIASPESAGMSSERLDRLAAHFAGEVDRRGAAGYTLLVARNGRLVYSKAIGFRNLEQRVPMTLDTRFRIASMTKPVTTVAVLMLYEQGRFLLDDPVARFLPEFAHPRVYTGGDAEGHFTTEPAHRDITIRDLLTHASGLGYAAGFDRTTPLGKVYAALDLSTPGTLADKVRQIATLPLYFHPGENWRYSYADDVLGRLVEVVSGVPFETFLDERIFKPLQMTATTFYLPVKDKPLLATVYKHDADAGLKPSDSRWLSDPTTTDRWPSGGGGLISTAGNYLRFAQMLANGGRFEGRQYLSPVTVDLMTSNQVPEDAMFKYWGSDSVGLGYGLGVGVEIDTRRAPQAGYAGDYSWGGALDTHWIVSPATGLVAVLLTQIDPSGNTVPQRTDREFRNLLFAAVTARSVENAGRPALHREPTPAK
jgi:CubicO group peptidase (beta-lactamase class C family)